MGPRRSTTLNFGFLVLGVLCLYTDFQVTHNQLELPTPVKEFLHYQNFIQNKTVSKLVPDPVGGSERLQALLKGEDIEDQDPTPVNQNDSTDVSSLPPLFVSDDLPAEGVEEHQVLPSAKNVTARDTEVLLFSFLPAFRSAISTSLLKEMSSRNEFRLVMPFLHMHPKMGPYQRESLIKYITSAAEQGAVAFLRDMYFFDVTKLNFGRLVWTAVIQDPVERLTSLFLQAKREQGNQLNLLDKGTTTSNMSLEQCIMRKDPLCWHSKGQQKAMQLTFFCGQHSFCELVGSRSGLQMAKHQVESQFSVVGILEELTLTYAVLQEYVPKFFGNAPTFLTRTVEREELEMANFLKAIPGNLQQYLRELLKDEIEFYAFVKQRLHMQAVALGLIRDLF